MPKAMSRHQEYVAQWRRLLRAWPRLHPWQRKTLVARAYWAHMPRLKWPVVFALRAAMCMFALLFILPQHPMSIPTAVGSGVALALITQ